MHNGAKVNVEKVTKWHNENFTIAPKSRNESVKPKAKHEQRGSNPNRDCENEHKFQHSGYPLSFSEFIIAYLIVKEQRIYGKVCVKFWPAEILI